MKSKDSKYSMKATPRTLEEALLDGLEPAELPSTLRARLDSDPSAAELREIIPVVHVMDALGRRNPGLSADALDRTWSRLAAVTAASAPSRPSVMDQIRGVLELLTIPRLAMAAATLAAVAVGYSWLTAEGPVATLRFAEDRVRIGSGEHARGLQEVELACHSEIETAGGGAIVRYKSGVQVMLDARTVVAVEENRDLELKHGAAWVNVEKGNGEFHVRTPDMTLVVTGTSFGVQRDPAGTRIAVVEGSVRVAAAASLSESIPLSAGQAIRVAPGASSLGIVEGGAEIPSWAASLHAAASSAVTGPLVPSATVGSQTPAEPAK